MDNVHQLVEMDIFVPVSEERGPVERNLGAPEPERKIMLAGTVGSWHLLSTGWVTRFAINIPVRAHKVWDFIKFHLVEVAFMQFFQLVVVGREQDVLESPVGMKVDALETRCFGRLRVSGLGFKAKSDSPFLEVCLHAYNIFVQSCKKFHNELLN